MMESSMERKIYLIFSDSVDAVCETRVIYVAP